MKNTTSKKIRIQKGAILVDGVQHLTGKTVEVSEELFRFLASKRSPSLRFEEVTEEGEILPPSDLTPQALEGQDNGGGEEGPESGDLTNGEGVELHDLQPITADQEEGAPVAPASPDPSGLGLKSVDAPLQAALAAAGFGSVEALKAATVPGLVAVRGIGKARAEAILQEVAGL